MIKLYQRTGCAASAKVRRALEGAGIEYYGVNVPKLGSERKELLAIEGVTSANVPVLVNGDVVLQGSEAILEYVEGLRAGRFGDPPYGLTRRFEGRSFAEVMTATREAIGTEGFGVLTEIDVKATMKKKLDVDFREYVILGACNPPLAHQALTAEPGIGVLLPCNVVVAEDPDGSVIVSAVDPVKMFSVVEVPGMEPIADEVRGKLVRALKAI